MSFSTSNSLIGLSLLTGSPVGSGANGGAVESKAVRLAKAQFTLPVVTPPWKQPASSVPESAQVSAVRRLATIIDGSGTGSLPEDVQAAFTAYKALDRLRLLASAAVRPGVSDEARSGLQASFGKGLTDLQSYLAAAPGERLTLSFDKPARRADSISLAAPPGTEIAGTPVASTRDAPLAGLTGTEKFTLTLSRTGTSDSFALDLATVPQPPRLDGIAAALNAAIAAAPMLDASGNPVLDASGNVRPKWSTSFAVVKSADGWGLQLKTMGIETVALRQVGAADALVVGATQAAAGAAATTGLSRFVMPGGALERTRMGELSAVDTQATAAAQLLPAPKPLLPDAKPVPVQVHAAMTTGAMVTDADGFTYAVGTTGGSLGANLDDGSAEMVLTKLDNRGAVVWQRSLGVAGTTEGAALALAPDGGIVIAGTAAGDVGGAPSDGDMLVAKYSTAGDEEFVSLVRSLGADRAEAVAVAGDGSIVVGGRNAAGEGQLVRLDVAGRVAERRSLGSGIVRAVAFDGDGSLLSVVQTGSDAVLRRTGAGLSQDFSSLALVGMDARALAVDDDGRIAVGGSATLAGQRDGAVALVDAALGSENRIALASGGDDRVDSVAFLGGKLQAGGRTTGSIGAPRTGSVDGFVASIDVASGVVTGTSQWGRSGVAIGEISLAAAVGGDSAVSRLGFRAGVLNPPSSLKLVAQTSLRAGDAFTLRVDEGKAARIEVAAGDTLDTLVARIQRTAGKFVTVSAAKVDGGLALRIEAKPGHSLDLGSGASGKDALAKLGLAPARLVGPPLPDPKAPRVQPGGNYGLGLSGALNLKDPASAKLALDRIQNAISTTQSAFRSLYWDDNKAALAAGGSGGRVSAYQSKQLARYQDALVRLGGGS